MDDTNGDSIGIYDAENGVDTKVRKCGFCPHKYPLGFRRFEKLLLYLKFFGEYVVR